jgi:quercetin dioxygenase-like cupin family protein
MSNKSLEAGITRSGGGKEWFVLGHTYWLKAVSETSFCFETYDPPGTFVPPHIHPTQDEFIYVLEGQLDLQLGTEKQVANPGDLIRMPMGMPHAYYNNSDAPTRALFWVAPAGKLKELFDALDNLEDVDEVVRLSAAHDVNFLPPET